ncbi:glycosylhydrolase-like jelly roll fold domain-containing protein [Sphingobium sp. CAP-1]|uniref:glycosylhydrolase-like jelly roll fold domain-containing protein n=1 Tax=Sphingobium sp. CAP-1 TaxID=2676077 RepID=UPI0012BB3F30|nr:glycosylhydrolase-like jelly roll fold domain-containing protein [Sphingobium sp. CAP-1]QGP79433.1 hypothetical protein GL174_10895 [Sphingobium sp. CAP-1]
MVDLGQVGDVAAVMVNGEDLGTVWKAPFQVEIGKAVRNGANSLEVRVATTWVNRLIGDAQLGAVKTSFTTFPTYRPDAPLRLSGLRGPVTLIAGSAPRRCKLVVGRWRATTKAIFGLFDQAKGRWENDRWTR